jgi:hypothetical protein
MPFRFCYIADSESYVLSEAASCNDSNSFPSSLISRTCPETKAVISWGIITSNVLRPYAFHFHYTYILSQLNTGCPRIFHATRDGSVYNENVCVLLTCPLGS